MKKLNPLSLKVANAPAEKSPKYDWNKQSHEGCKWGTAMSTLSVIKGCAEDWRQD